MKFEETCDRLLKAAREWNDYHPMKRLNLLSAAVKDENLAEDLEYFDGALAKLVADGFLTENTQNGTHVITPAGKAFSYTDSYVIRRQEKDAEKKHSEKAYRKMVQEMRMLWVTAAIALASLIVSIIALNSADASKAKAKPGDNQGYNYQHIADTLKNHK